MLQLPTGANTTTRLIQSSRYSVLLLGRQACFTTSRFQKRNHSYLSKEIHIACTDKGEVYGVWFDGSDVSKIKFAGPFFNIEQKLFNLYACQKLEIDVESIEDIDLDFDSEDDD